MLSQAVQQLTALRLGPMATRLQQWADDPANQGKSHVECVLALASAQHQAATNTRVQRVFHRADLAPSISVGDPQEWGRRGLASGTLGNLRTCDWIRRGHCLVITGDSRAGKTVLASALLREATLASISMVYWRLPEYLDACETEASKGPAVLARFQKRQAKAGLLVLDDFAMERIGRKQCYWLRQLLDARSRHGRALMVVSPNAIDNWQGYFKDTASAEAIFARVLAKHHHIELKAPPLATREVG